MRFQRFFGAGVSRGVLLLAVLLFFAQSPSATETSSNSSLAAIEFPPQGAAKADEAATSLFRACIQRSPKQFMQHLCLGVCDGPIDSIRKFADCLHFTTFSDGEHAFTVYDLQERPKRMNPETARVVAGQAFTEEDVASLESQFVSTYWGKQLTCFELAADSYDGIEYRTRIVVTLAGDRWHAIPRCSSSKSFYEIADAMRFPAHTE